MSALRMVAGGGGGRVEVLGLVGVAAFAEKLGKLGVRVGRQAVWRWVSEGKLEGVKIGKQWYVRGSELERVVRCGLVSGQGSVVGGQRGGGKGNGEEVGMDRGQGTMEKGGVDVFEGLTPELARARAVARVRRQVGGRVGAEEYCRLHGL